MRDNLNSKKIGEIEGEKKGEDISYQNEDKGNTLFHYI
jgi:hypothetical protein